MAPSTTGSSVAAPAANGAASPSHLPHHAQRRPVVKSSSAHHVVLPVLPLSLAERHRRAQLSVSSPTAAAHAVKHQPAAAPLRSPTSPLASEVDLPNLAALATNGADSGVKHDGAPNGNGSQHKKPHDAKDAPPTPSAQQHPSFAVSGQAGTPTTTSAAPSVAAREPLTSTRSTNALPSPRTLDDFNPPHQSFADHRQHPRGKENIPPAPNGPVMAQTQVPPFHPPHMPMHHPHPSESSILFGGFPDSNNTSPAPASAGMYPPPAPMHFAAYPPMRHGPNGYAPPPGHMGRPVPMPLPSGTMPGYPGPAMMSFAPSTPRSFHGSQTSNTVEAPVGFEENGYHHQPPPPMPANGAGPGAEGPGVFPPGGPNSSRQSSFNMPRSHELSQMHQRDAREYIEYNFNNRETADCQLVVNFDGEDADRPWRSTLHLFGHRLVLGFSPALRAQIRAVHEFGGTMVITADDPYLRNDILWTCLGSFYGRPIPEYPSPDSTIAAAYLAAGNFLQLGAIIMKGTDDVIRLISGWDSLERACSLALGGAVHQFPGSAQAPGHEFLHRYGHASERIVDAIASYIIDNFPHNFALDQNLPSAPYNRIPEIPNAFQTATHAHADEASQKSGPPRSSGPRNSNPLLSQIKFGDLALSDAKVGEEPPKKPQDQLSHEIKPLSARLAARGPATPNALISSVLVNLPFGVLKHVMENNGPGNISGWTTTQARYKVVSQVVAERERRRIDAVNAVASGIVAGPSVRARLASTQPPVGGPSDPWDVLGWQEQVVGSDESPQLVRAWVPLSTNA